MKKVLFTAYILFSLLSNNFAYALDNKADVTLILLDISTSMEKLQVYEDKRISRFEVALDSVEKVLKKYNYSDKIGLRTIGISSQKLLDDLTSNSDQITNIINTSKNPLFSLYKKTCNQSSLIVPISESSLSRIYDVIKTINCDGTSTPIEYSLKQAIEVDFAKYPLSVKKHIILITDGYEGCGGDPCGYIKNLTSTRNDITIDVISVLPPTADFSLYYCLTEPTGGGIYNPTNPKPSFNSNVDLQKITPACPKCKAKTSTVSSIEKDVEYRTFLLQFE